MSIMLSEMFCKHSAQLMKISSREIDIEDIFERMKAGKGILPSEAWILLDVNPNDNVELFSQILQLSRGIKSGFFHEEIYPIVPLYVSSFCQEHCIYCNYRAENKDNEIKRVRLSKEELAIEAEFLAKKGFRAIELVYATDPLTTADHLADHIKITHGILSAFGGGLVGINARAFSLYDYRKLRESGLDFAVLWQETYDEDRYREVHPGNSEKMDFNYRLDAPERMIEAGIENIGLGVLSGLTDWKRDWLFLMNHVSYLLQEYRGKIGTLILGIPRLKPAAGALLTKSQFIPTDREFLLAICVFNLFLPNALPFVNTRESWDMCLEIAKGGGTLFTLDCKTIPGGYALGRRGYQFPTNNFSTDEYVRKLYQNGLNPIFNWNFNHFNRHSS